MCNGFTFIFNSRSETQTAHTATTTQHNAQHNATIEFLFSGDFVPEPFVRVSVHYSTPLPQQLAICKHVLITRVICVRIEVQFTPAIIIRINK